MLEKAPFKALCKVISEPEGRLRGPISKRHHLNWWTHTIRTKQTSPRHPYLLRHRKPQMKLIALPRQQLKVATMNHLYLLQHKRHKLHHHHNQRINRRKNGLPKMNKTIKLRRQRRVKKSQRRSIIRAVVIQRIHSRKSQVDHSNRTKKLLPLCQQLTRISETFSLAIRCKFG